MNGYQAFFDSGSLDSPDEVGMIVFVIVLLFGCALVYYEDHK
jgi:hypothetical protein